MAKACNLGVSGLSTSVKLTFGDGEKERQAMSVGVDTLVCVQV